MSISCKKSILSQKTAKNLSLSKHLGIFLFFIAIGAGRAEAVYPVAGQRKFSLAGFLFAFFVFSAGLVVALPAEAADYYIAQTAAGSADATSCVNAKASSWNWTSPNVSDGDIVYLCGTFTSNVNVPKSGISAAITLKSCKDSENNCGTGNAALFSAPYWGYLGSAAISCSGHDHILIDGNGVGIIQATANGDQLANQQNGWGIYIANTNGVEVRNWTIRNLYVKVYNDSSHGGTVDTDGIWADNSSNLSINNNTIHDVSWAILHRNTSGGPNANINIFNNTISACNWGAQTIAGVSGSVTDGVNINNNEIEIGANWYVNPDIGYHVNGSYNFVSDASGIIQNLHFYNNYIHGVAGFSQTYTSTAMFWVSGSGTNQFPGLKVFNNLMVGMSYDPANEYIGAGDQGFVANNTVVGYRNTNQGCSGIVASGTPTVKNNIVSNCYIGIYYPVIGTSFTNDNNILYNNGETGVINLGGTMSWDHTLAQWQTSLGGCPGTGHDCNSLASNPDLSATYTLNNESPAIGAGANLTSVGVTALNSDKAGVARPQGSAWDIGAYEYQSSGDIIVPGAPGGLVVW